MVPRNLIIVVLFTALAFWPIPTLGQEKEKAIDPQAKQILKQISGSLATTEAADTAAIAGDVDIDGSLTATEASRRES